MPSIEQVARLLCCWSGECESDLRRKREENEGNQHITQMPCSWPAHTEAAEKIIALFSPEFSRLTAALSDEKAAHEYTASKLGAEIKEVERLTAERDEARAALGILFPPPEPRPDGTEVDHSADENLEAAIIDLEMRGADKVCIQTLNAVLAMLVAARIAHEQLTPAHASDCAVHNAPALPVGPCDCGVEKQTP